MQMVLNILVFISVCSWSCLPLSLLAYQGFLKSMRRNSDSMAGFSAKDVFRDSS
jgi:hypothetical protein